MKIKKVISVFLILCLAISIFAGCDKNKDNEPTTENSTSTTEKTTEKKKNYNKIYNGILNEYYDYVLNFDSDADVPDGKNGVADVTRYSESNRDALSKIGYAIKDINNDGVSELMICPYSNISDGGTNILALFTCKNDKPQYLAESWSRSAYYLTENDNLFYYGSGGAAHTYFGTYEIDESLTELKATAYYFSSMKEDYEISYFKNNTGEEATDVSTEISIEEFWKDNDKLLASTVEIELTQLASLKNTENNVQELSYVIVGNANEWVDVDTAIKTGAYEFFKADDSEYGTVLGFMQSGKIKDFKLYYIESVDYVDNKPAYVTEEIYQRDTLSNIDPILIQMSFPGSMPSYAFSYTDEEGTKSFALSLSGEDGSVAVSEIKL